MQSKAQGREALLIAVTLLRLGFAVGLCMSVWQNGRPFVSLLWLIAIVIADIGDGILARRFGVDNTARRIVDAVVDRISIHSAGIVIVWVHPGSLWLMAPIIARDVTLIFWNWGILHLKHSFITAGNIHRMGTTMYAVVFAIALFSTGTEAKIVSALFAVAVWFLLIDYLRAGLLIPKQPRNRPLARYQACGLRNLRGIAPTLKNPDA